MRKNTPILVAILTITFLMSMPTYVQVHAITQTSTQKTSWSPFGPATPDLVIHDYSDFGTMFTAFKSGQVDITDWPVQAPDVGTFCAPTQADIWCSAQDPEFGIFQLDVNNHAPFLGKAMQQARPALVGSVATLSSGPSSACTAGGQLRLNVVNLENGGAVYKDSSNTVTIANQPSGTPASLPTNDAGSATPNGTYVFPCILAGNYLISGSIVTGNATSGTHLACGSAAGCIVAIPNLGTVVATWNAVYNSPSTLTPTAAMPNIMKALAHLVNKPEFVQHDAILLGGASCLDTNLAPAHLIQGSPCVANPPLSGLPGAPFPASVLTRECAANGGVVTNDAVITACNPISAYDLVDANTGAGAVWWGVPGRTARGSVATGYASPADIDAACQYIIAAGFTLSGATTGPNTCAALAQNSVGTTAPAATAYTHFTAPAGTHFVALLRTDPPRAHFGQIVADSINMLFGTPNDSGSCPSPCSQTSSGTATVLYYTTGAALQPTAAYNSIRVAVPIVFGDGGTGIADRWNIYTGGFSLGSTPDFLFAAYHSQFASTDCGAAFNLFPSNYVFHCDPAFDAITNAGEFQAISTPTLTGASTVFTDAASRAYDLPINVPQYAHIQQFAELNGWNWQQSGSGLSSSLVVQKGHGTQTGFWSLLNARQLPGYTPSNPVFTPGGGNPNLIRRGFSQDPDTINVYQATTVWDFEIIGQVFDSMAAVNPTTGGANQQVIDWMTTDHRSSFQPNELGCIAGPSVVATSCVKGITTQTWHLRSDLFFHDGTPVTAQDVVYSILTQRDDPSANGFPSVAFVTNAVALDAKTVQVKLVSNSAFYELNIGGVPIVPQHLYQGPGGSVCGSISSLSTPAGPVNVVANGPSSACADPGFDPVTCVGSAGAVAGCGTTFADGSVQGIFTGSGPYVCNNVATGTTAFGKPGGTCIQSSTGAPIGGTSMSTDSRVLLTANMNYMRGIRGGQNNALQKANWGDFNKDGQVGIDDGSNMARFFDQTNSYWAHPQYACTSTTTVVDVCVASGFAALFDTGNAAPFAVSQLVNGDPQIDPYSMALGSTTCLYYQTTTSTVTGLELVACNSAGPGTLPSGHTLSANAFPKTNLGLGTAVSGAVSVSGSHVKATWSSTLTSKTLYVVIVYDTVAPSTTPVEIGRYYVPVP